MGDSLTQGTTTSQPEFTSLTHGKNIEAPINVSQQSMEIKSSVHKSLESGGVPQTIKSKDSQETSSCAFSTLSSKETDSIDQTIQTGNVEEIRSSIPFSQQSIQSVLSAELTADAGGRGGNRETGSNIQHMEDINKRIDVHQITDVNKRVADVVSSMASTLESISAAA